MSFSSFFTFKAVAIHEKFDSLSLEKIKSRIILAWFAMVNNKVWLICFACLSLKRIFHHANKPNSVCNGPFSLNFALRFWLSNTSVNSEIHRNKD